jgi:hypothetical protein
MRDRSRQSVKILRYLAMFWVTLAPLLFMACKSHMEADGKPSLEETISWMHDVLYTHNGQRLDDVSGIQMKNDLSATGCQLKYVVNSDETVLFDLHQVDQTTIKIEKIGKAYWVTFNNRNFGQTTQYKHPDAKDDYTAETGGFSLDDQDHATSFQNALKHAVSLCGGRPSTF